MKLVRPEFACPFLNFPAIAPHLTANGNPEIRDQLGWGATRGEMNTAIGYFEPGSAGA